MKIIYRHHNNWEDRQKCPVGEQNILCLHSNSWDDFGSRTTLDATLFFGGELFLVFICKILVEGNNDTTNALNEQKRIGWDGVLPIPNLNYISVVSDIQFYSSIKSKLEDAVGIKVLENLRDAGYLISVAEDNKAKLLSETTEFNSSLLRETGASKSYSDGWKVFVLYGDTGINDFVLNLVDRKKIPYRYPSISKHHCYLMTLMYLLDQMALVNHIV